MRATVGFQRVLTNSSYHLCRASGKLATVLQQSKVNVLTYYIGRPRRGERVLLLSSDSRRRALRLVVYVKYVLDRHSPAAPDCGELAHVVPFCIRA